MKRTQSGEEEGQESARPGTRCQAAQPESFRRPVGAQGPETFPPGAGSRDEEAAHSAGRPDARGTSADRRGHRRSTQSGQEHTAAGPHQEFHSPKHHVHSGACDTRFRYHATRHSFA